MKSFLPEFCPECGGDLVIETGKKDDTLRLMCKNPDCVGTAVKKLQKGITELEIRGLGPSTIEKLFHAGITQSVDLFDKSKFNAETLIKSGEFKAGRALEKILDSVSNITTLPIQKIILSLQIMVPKEDGDGFISIGRSLSEQIGKMLSGVPYSFDGLSIQVRRELLDKNSPLLRSIIDSISVFEESVIVERFSTKKVEVVTQKITKKVHVIGEPTSLGLSKAQFLEKLSWTETSVEDCDFVVSETKEVPGIDKKIMTYKQVKTLFL